MFRRKWFVRILVFTIVALCGAGVMVYERFTNPAAVREQVIAKLNTLFAGAQVTVDSARLRILGGINVNELRLARKDDPDKSEILHVPSAVVYHNKQKLLEGELVLSKVVLHRPRLRVVRSKDGAWNLQGIGGKLQPNLALPTIVIHQGTLVFEDRGEGGTGKILELSGVDLRLVNDPLPQITIEGSASSEVAGKLRILGQWQRYSQDVTLNVEAEQISMAGIVVERLEKLCPFGTLDGLKLDGKADLKADVAFHPGLSQPLSYDASLKVTNASLQHPKLPLPLEQMNVSIRCSNGDLRLEKLQARSGATEIEAHGSALVPGLDQTFEVHLEARHLQMREELFRNLPEKLQILYRTFQPSGPATFRADVCRRDGAWAALPSGEPAAVHLLPEAMGVNFVKFPYPVERVTGTVDMNLLTRLIQVDVTGYSGTHPVLLNGTWQGEGVQADCRLDLQGVNIALDEKVVNAMVLPNFKKLAESFHARGAGDIKAHIFHEPGAKEFHNEYHVRFHDTAIRWEQFPYPLENVSGYLDIYPRHWEFRDGRGTHHGAEVFVKGGSNCRDGKDGAASPGLVLDIEGHNLPVDEELHGALHPMAQLAQSWKTFRPSGRLNFRAKIDHQTLAPEDVEVELDLHGCTIEPVFFPFVLDEVAGKFHYQKNKLDIRSASARHKGTTLKLDKGTVDLQKGGGHYTDLTELNIKGALIQEDLLRALPPILREGMEQCRLEGPIDLKSRLVVSQEETGSAPDIYWDGQCWFKDAKFATGLEWSKVTGTAGSVGRYNGRQLMGVTGNVLLSDAMLVGQPFRGVQARFQIKENAPEVLLLGLRAPLYGGDISGEARIEFVHPLRYELNLTGSQLDLGQFGRHNLGAHSQMSGAVMTRLHLTGQGTGIDTLDGHGSIDVPSGRLYNLPLLLDLLKFLGLRWPDRTAFEELHALISIHGKRVTMRKLEILGSAISLTGKGEFNLDGTDVALDFYPGWPRLDQLLPPAVRPLPPAVGKNLLTIEMRGKITPNEKDRKFTMKPVPGIVDPFLQMRNLLTGGPAREKHEEPRAAPVVGADARVSNPRVADQ